MKFCSISELEQRCVGVCVGFWNGPHVYQCGPGQSGHWGTWVLVCSCVSSCMHTCNCTTFRVSVILCMWEGVEFVPQLSGASSRCANVSGIIPMP